MKNDIKNEQQTIHRLAPEMVRKSSNDIGSRGKNQKISRTIKRYSGKMNLVTMIELENLEFLIPANMH